MKRLLIACLFLAVPLAAAQDGFSGRFDTVWSLVNERYWNLDMAAHDWDDVHDEYAPLAAGLTDEEEYFSLMEDMLEEIGDDHSVFVPPSGVESIRQLYGDLPCLAFTGQAGSVPGAVIAHEVIGLGSGLTAGYVRLPDLASDNVARDLRHSVQQLEAAGVDGYVLDLRGNPGGRLVSMMQAAGIFTTGFLWRTITTWSLPLPYPALGLPETDLPLAILIDGNVHSAAEGLAGALRQTGRAVTVGQATAGNVEAVLPFCLRDGSQVWVAAGVLAPIGAPTWQETGVEPDIAADPEDALAAALEWLSSAAAP